VNLIYGIGPEHIMVISATTQDLLDEHPLVRQSIRGYESMLDHYLKFKPPTQVSSLASPSNSPVNRSQAKNGRNEQ
jgi:hypothetical protein